MTSGHTPEPGPVDEAWARLGHLFIAGRDRFLASSRELGLTPPQTHALMSLGRGPVRMGAMADTLVCDASYVTSIVDRLEELGLAERQPSSVDRRVKDVVLTATGRHAVGILHASMFQPPDALHGLSERDQRDLIRIARRLMPSELDGPPLNLR